MSPAPFQLAVQGFVRAWATADVAILPALRKLVRRGSVTETRLAQQGWSAWHLQLLELLGVEADRLHASAPLEWLGQGGEPRPGSWLQAEFVHLEVGTHSARLQQIKALAPDDAAALVDALRLSLVFPGIEVLPPPLSQQTSQLFLYSASPVEAVCFPVDFQAATELREVLPQGRDGPLLRRLLTEAQMVLHDHAVNVKRERHGLPRVNAIWPAGLGDFAGLRSALLPSIVSDDLFLKGLGRLHGTQVQHVADSAVQALMSRGSGLVALSIAESEDSSAELHALEKNFLAPLVDALGKGRLSAVELTLDQFRVHLDRRDLRRFWRRGSLSSGLMQ